jgi:hypothetical protein
MTPNDRITAWIRTAVPYAIGAALAWLLATLSIDLRGEFEVALIAFGIALVQNLYYIAVRLLERVLPGAGFLLGVPSTPEYAELSNFWASVVRTGIPTIVGALVVTLAAFVASTFGYGLSDAAVVNIVAIVVPLVQAAYYAIARSAVKRWPGASVLLGRVEPPTYSS